MPKKKKGTSINGVAAVVAGGIAATGLITAVDGAVKIHEASTNNSENISASLETNTNAEHEKLSAVSRVIRAREERNFGLGAAAVGSGLLALAIRKTGMKKEEDETESKSR